MTQSQTSPHEAKVAASDFPIHALIARRWSPRAYANQPVEAAKLRQLFQAARWSASSGNGQPWSFLIATQDDPAAFGKMVAALNEGNVTWAAHAPILGIVVAEMIRPNGRSNRVAFYDVGMAMQNLLLQATELGLSLRQMGGFSPDKARELFQIPPEHEAVVMFALGYAGDPDQLADNHRSQEMAARERKPLSDFVFAGKWGDTAPLVADEE